MNNKSIDNEEKKYTYDKQTQNNKVVKFLPFTFFSLLQLRSIHTQKMGTSAQKEILYRCLISLHSILTQLLFAKLAFL